MDELDLFRELSAELDSLVATYNAAIADKRVDVNEVLEIGFSAGRSIHRVVSRYADVPKDMRREAYLRALNDFSKKVVGGLDIPYVPAYVEDIFVKPAVNQMAHAIANALFTLLDDISTDEKSVG